MENKEYKPIRHYLVAIYVTIAVVVFFFYSYNDKLHIIKKSNSTVYANDDINIAGASVEITQNDNLGKISSVDTTRAYLKNTSGKDLLVVVTATSEFVFDVYTIKNHYLDLGLPYKDEGDYPPILISGVSRLPTGGVIVETVQTLGTDTYANKVYIKDDKIIDVGFQIRTGIRDNIIYYDNVVLIIDTLNKDFKDVIRVYDDETGNLIIDISDKDVPVLNDSEFGIMCSAVGNNFISFSDLHTNTGGENFIDFLDNPSEVKSVWDHVDASEEQLQNLINYEKTTMGQCLMFQHRDVYNELIYTINYPAKTDILDVVTIQLAK